MSVKSNYSKANDDVVQNPTLWSVRVLNDTREGITTVAKVLDVPKGFVIDLMVRAYAGKTPRHVGEWKELMKAERGH